MKPIDYYNSLATEQKDRYAEQAGTTLNYLRSHVFRADGKFTRSVSHQMVVRLAKASEGNVSLDEAIEYFLVQPVKSLAAESKGSTNSISKNITPPSGTLRSHESPAPAQAALF